MKEKKLLQKNNQDALYSECVKALHDYYKIYGRHDLAWRKKITPYTILVSELMLQQTQVTRVIPKYDAWVKQYPTLSSLREVSLSDVLVLWQGLGYQRRAKALYEIAQSCTRLPRGYTSLLDLSGIGPYTAGALCAFAYNTFVPILETNIRTVILHHIYHDTEEKVDDMVMIEDVKKLYELSHLSPRDFYYACMDYGSYLKAQGIKTNHRVKGYAKQKPYKGSQRELRAQTLFAITHCDVLPKDERLPVVLEQLVTEGFIVKKGKGYIVKG